MCESWAGSINSLVLTEGDFMKLFLIDWFVVVCHPVKIQLEIDRGVSRLEGEEIWRMINERARQEEGAC